jgi:hypothetical protein
LEARGAGTRPEVVKSLLEIALRAVVGGLFVTAFALVAEALEPKRLAGIFSAAPSVALASLMLTVVFKGHADAAAATRGMAVGAAAFTAYCLVDVPALNRWGALRGSVLSLTVWGALVAAIGLAVAG